MLPPVFSVPNISRNGETRPIAGNIWETNCFQLYGILLINIFKPKSTKQSLRFCKLDMRDWLSPSCQQPTGRLGRMKDPQCV
jgi:hypothetical protein